MPAPTPAAPDPRSRPLRVVLVTKHAIGGGAERIAVQLLEGLRQHGHETWLAAAQGDFADAAMLRIPRGRPRGGKAGARLRKLARSVRRRGSSPVHRATETAMRAVADPPGWWREQRGRERFDYPGTASIPHLAPVSPDVIHCHNLHGGYFDLRQLAPMSRQLPVVLSLHDEWTYTGHCAAGLGCERWRTGCGSCPDLAIYPAIKRDGTHANWEAKREVYAHSRLYATAPSEWLLERARSSILAEGVAEWRLIRHGIDTMVFVPADRAAARVRLGLPVDASIVLFAANGARRNPFKDWATVWAAVQAAGRELPGRQLLFLVLGDDGPPDGVANVELRFVPYQPDPSAVAAYYQAADLYVLAARAESAGLTVMEALATGLPVVATAVGAIPEAVQSLGGAPGAWSGRGDPVGEATGILVPPANAGAMGHAVAALLRDEGLRRQLSMNAARDAAQRYGLERQMVETVDFYRDAIADWHLRARQS